MPAPPAMILALFRRGVDGELEEVPGSRRPVELHQAEPGTPIAVATAVDWGPVDGEVATIGLLNPAGDTVVVEFDARRDGLPLKPGESVSILPGALTFPPPTVQ